MKKNNLIFILPFFSAFVAVLIIYILQPASKIPLTLSVFYAFFAMLVFYILLYISQPIFKIPRKLAKIKIGENIFSAKVIDANDKKTKRLFDHKPLSKNTGNLFVFEKPAPISSGFWMKDMKFPIDIIWIQDDKVVGFMENIKSESGVSHEHLTTHSSSLLIDMALEVSAGTVNQKNIRAGDKVSSFSRSSF